MPRGFWEEFHSEFQEGGEVFESRSNDTQKVCEIGPSQMEISTKINILRFVIFGFSQKLIQPVLIESSLNSTMATCLEHLLTPSEPGDMVHFS